MLTRQQVLDAPAGADLSTYPGRIGIGSGLDVRCKIYLDGKRISQRVTWVEPVAGVYAEVGALDRAAEVRQVDPPRLRVEKLPLSDLDLRVIADREANHATA